MIENFIPHGFISEHAMISDPVDSDVMLFFSDNSILLLDNNRIPQWQDIKQRTASQTQPFYYFGRLDKQRYLLADHLDDALLQHPTSSFHAVRFTQERLGEPAYRLAGLACQLHHWRSTHAYCGHCGTQNREKPDERAKICPRCQLISYPQLYPCVIVLVSRGTELLLARSPHFQPGVYSTLAGFIEPGESAEDAVFREVKEEVNIATRHIRYMGSQPWPFPNSLMLGFLAEYEDGEIKIDHKEIEDAQWFKVAQLPKLPSALSISRWLIEGYLTKK